MFVGLVVERVGWGLLRTRAHEGSFTVVCRLAFVKLLLDEITQECEIEVQILHLKLVFVDWGSLENVTTFVVDLAGILSKGPVFDTLLLNGDMLARSEIVHHGINISVFNEAL